MLSKDGKVILSCAMTDDTRKYGCCASCGYCRDWTNTADIKEGEPGYCEHGEVFSNPWDEVEYNGYWISRNIYGNGEYSVQYDGDDIIFDDVNDAKDFIDTVV